MKHQAPIVLMLRCGKVRLISMPVRVVNLTVRGAKVVAQAESGFCSLTERSYCRLIADLHWAGSGLLSQLGKGGGEYRVRMTGRRPDDFKCV